MTLNSIYFHLNFKSKQKFQYFYINHNQYIPKTRARKKNFIKFSFVNWLKHKMPRNTDACIYNASRHLTHRHDRTKIVLREIVQYMSFWTNICAFSGILFNYLSCTIASSFFFHDDFRKLQIYSIYVIYFRENGQTLFCQNKYIEIGVKWTKCLKLWSVCVSTNCIRTTIMMIESFSNNDKFIIEFCFDVNIFIRVISVVSLIKKLDLDLP